MTLREFAELVRRMRRAQARYFRTKDPAALSESRRLEKAVDEACAALLAPGDLFAEGEGNG